MKSIFFCVAAFIFATGTYCQADVVNIDIGRAANTSTGNINNITESFANGVIGVSDPDGDGVFTPDGTITNGTALALIDDTGASSGFSVDVFTQNIPNDVIAVAGAGGDFGGPFPPSLSTIPASALEDGLFLRDEGGDEFLHFVFSGLSATDVHSLSVFGARGNNGIDTVVSVTDGINGAVLGTSTFNPFNNQTAVTFGGLLADANGEITLRVNAPGTVQSGTVNFIQLETTAVPEPSSAIFLTALGCVALVRRRR